MNERISGRYLRDQGFINPETGKYDHRPDYRIILSDNYDIHVVWCASPHCKYDELYSYLVDIRTGKKLQNIEGYGVGWKKSKKLKLPNVANIADPIVSYFYDYWRNKFIMRA